MVLHCENLISLIEYFIYILDIYKCLYTKNLLKNQSKKTNNEVEKWTSFGHFVYYISPSFFV